MQNKIRVHVDGGSRGNPGPAALGVAIGPPINKGYSKYLGKATNNEAEYQAAIFALEKIRSLVGRTKVKNLCEGSSKIGLLFEKVSIPWKA